MRYTVVIPPRAGTGLRHAVRESEPDRTLCGMDPDGWFGDYATGVVTDPALLLIGCRRCAAAVGVTRGAALPARAPRLPVA